LRPATKTLLLETCTEYNISILFSVSAVFRKSPKNLQLIDLLKFVDEISVGICLIGSLLEHQLLMLGNKRAGRSVTPGEVMLGD
jgi:hypothetical protein